MKYMSNFLDFRFPQTEQTWYRNCMIPPHRHGFDDGGNDDDWDDDSDDDHYQYHQNHDNEEEEE